MPINGIISGGSGDGGPSNTDGLPEGTTNLYFTNNRVTAVIAAQKGAANGLAGLDAGAFVPRVNLSFLASNVAAPNATIPVQSFLAVDAGFADIDLALVPKGAGGFSVSIADNAITGGNKRGARAVDLQFTRTLATHVASGADSFIAGSTGSTASVARSSVISSITSTASGIGAAVLGATSSTASGANALISASTSSLSSASRAFNLGTFNSSSNGQNGGNVGGQYGFTNARNGFVGSGAIGSGTAVIGRHQIGMMSLAIETSGVATTAITADAASISATNQMTLQANSALRFRGFVVARSNAGDVKEWAIDGLIKRGATAASTALVGVPTATSTFGDTGATTWSVAVVADTVNGALQINVTGVAATTIRWTSRISGEEVA